MFKKLAVVAVLFGMLAIVPAVFADSGWPFCNPDSPDYDQAICQAAIENYRERTGREVSGDTFCGGYPELCQAPEPEQPITPPVQSEIPAVENFDCGGFIYQKGSLSLGQNWTTPDGVNHTVRAADNGSWYCNSNAAPAPEQSVCRTWIPSGFYTIGGHYQEVGEYGRFVLCGVSFQAEEPAPLSVGGFVLNNWQRVPPGFITHANEMDWSIR